MSTDSDVLWVPAPEAASRAQLAQFMRFVEGRERTPVALWDDFHRFSVKNYRKFWGHFLVWSGIRFDGDPREVCHGDSIETTRFFPGLSLSFTDHLLDGAGSPDEAPAVFECREALPPRVVTRRELRERVAATARALRDLGVGPGTNVVGVVANDADTICVALAAVGLGATWSACGAELAPPAVVERFEQLEPHLLVTTRAVQQDGRTIDLLASALTVAAQLPSLRATVVTEGSGRRLSEVVSLPAWPHPVFTLDEILRDVDGSAFSWERFGFNHPLYVLYTSGTTGPPKAIVHGAGGTLIEHLKEHRLHGDLRAGDRLFFQTTCGWMMWHWMLSALATGAAIITYDGSVSWPGPDALWAAAEACRTTVFGASPPFVQFCHEANVSPRAHDLGPLRSFLSTGSVLDDEHFDWLHSALDRVQIQSISGGTDILGCFVLGNPLLPVRRGKIQCVGLAMDVRAVPHPEGGPSELVCASPFPSCPLGFLRDKDRSRFHDAYFAVRPGVWTHGDFVELFENGSARILGRSDGILNVRGIRIGPGELIAAATSLREVRRAMAVEQRDLRVVGGSRIVLLVVLVPDVFLDRTLTHKIKRTIRDRTSANHVPELVVDVPGLPETINGKLSVRAATDAVNGVVPRNLVALRDPAVLDSIRRAVPRPDQESRG